MSGTPTTIRRAAPSDVDAVAELFDGYRRFYEQQSDVEAAKRFVQSRLEAEDSVLLVAERTGALVGFTQLYPLFSSISMTRVWVLNDLFVMPQARKTGVAHALMDAAETFARESGARGLRLSTQSTNDAAKRLYESRQWTLDSVFTHYHRYF